MGTLPNYLVGLDGAKLFAPELTLAEAFARGTVIYVAMLVLLRVIPKRHVGTGTVANMLFVILIGGIAVKGVVGHTDSLTDIVLLVGTVMLWALAVDHLSYRSPWFRHLVQEPPTPLIRDGRVLTENLRRELITEAELATHLRRRDADAIASVREAHMEADGTISVIKRKEAHGTAPPERNGRQAKPARELADATDDPDLRDFLTFAERLQGKLAWHQHQVAEYKAALARHGIRPKSARPQNRPTDDAETHAIEHGP